MSWISQSTHLPWRLAYKTTPNYKEHSWALKSICIYPCLCMYVCINICIFACVHEIIHLCMYIFTLPERGSHWRCTEQSLLVAAPSFLGVFLFLKVLLWMEFGWNWSGAVVVFKMCDRCSSFGVQEEQKLLLSPDKSTKNLGMKILGEKIKGFVRTFFRVFS